MTWGLSCPWRQTNIRKHVGRKHHPRRTRPVLKLNHGANPSRGGTAHMLHKTL